MKMIVRRFHLILILIAGLFAFQGTFADAIPREATRTEVVVRIKQSGNPVQQVSVTAVPRQPEAIWNPRPSSIHEALVEELLLHSSIIAYQHHHSSL